MYKTVIFDLDGTLLDTLDDLAAAVNAALTAHRMPPRTRDEVRSFVGDGVALLVERALPDGRAYPAFDACLGDFKRIYAANSRVNTRPYDGIPSLLARLRERGVRVAVVSNKYDVAVRELCAHYFGDLVEVAVGERPEVRKKPAPDTVFEAMRALGLDPDSPTDRATCVYIGASDVDILTARAAGLDCISVLWGFRDAAFLRSAGATATAANVGELEALFWGVAPNPTKLFLKEKFGSKEL